MSPSTVDDPVAEFRARLVGEDPALARDTLRRVVSKAELKRESGTLYLRVPLPTRAGVSFC